MTITAIMLVTSKALVAIFHQHIASQGSRNVAVLF